MAPVSLENAKGFRRRDDASVSRMEAHTADLSANDPAPIGAMTFGQIIDHHRALLASDLGVELGAVRISIEAS